MISNTVVEYNLCKTVTKEFLLMGNPIEALWQNLTDLAKEYSLGGKLCTLESVIIDEASIRNTAEGITVSVTCDLKCRHKYITEMDASEVGTSEIASKVEAKFGFEKGNNSVECLGWDVIPDGECVVNDDCTVALIRCSESLLHFSTMTGDFSTDSCDLADSISTVDGFTVPYLCNVVGDMTACVVVRPAMLVTLFADNTSDFVTFAHVFNDTMSKLRDIGFGFSFPHELGSAEYGITFFGYEFVVDYEKVQNIQNARFLKDALTYMVDTAVNEIRDEQIPVSILTMMTCLSEIDGEI